MSILWQGARGDSVKVLQKRLRKEGFNPGRIDGFFGPVTKKAVTAFQKKQNLLPDGIAGPQILGALGIMKVPGKAEPSPALPEEANTRHSSRAPIFISYSHEDTKWLKMLIVHLAPLERIGMVERWDDTRTKAGEDWRGKITEAIAAARAAVLLVSAYFMASEFIMNNEVPPLLARAKDQGTVILPVIVSPCVFEPLSQFQAVNSPSKTLVDMDRGARERLWVKVVQRITEVLN